MASRFAALCALMLSLSGALAPVRAAQPDTAYPAATGHAVARALIQKVAELEAQYDTDEAQYSSGAPAQQRTEVALRALRARLMQMRPDGYRREVTRAIRRALTTRIAAQEVEAALAAGDSRRQAQAETQLMILRRHLTALPQSPYAEDRHFARL